MSISALSKFGFLKMSLPPTVRSHLQGTFRPLSYEVASKVSEYVRSHSAPLKGHDFPEAQCNLHNDQMPTLEDVNKDPALQETLSQMYAEDASDPEWEALTEESTAWGIYMMRRRQAQQKIK